MHSDGEFRRQLEQTFGGDYRVELHLAPPLLARIDPVSGEPRKRAYGPWIFPLLRLLAPLKKLRGTPFDPFGYSRDRRLERRLLADYEMLLMEIMDDLEPANHGYAVELARLPEQIRGYGPVKERNARQAAQRQAELLRLFRRPPRRAAA